MSLAILPSELEKIREHARRAYPHECCGAMIGKPDLSGWKLVTEAMPLENAQETGKALTWERGESARRRFEVTAEDFRAAEQRARDQRLELLGFYHSHPDHPARPSQHDLERAWPWFSYVIISVAQGEPGDVTSWELANDRARFNAETLQVAFGKLEAPRAPLIKEVKQDAR